MNVPAPLVLLVALGLSGGGLPRDRMEYLVEKLRAMGIDLGYTWVELPSGRRVSRELVLDINLLKTLRLVEEVDGILRLTERGRKAFEKAIRFQSIPKRIVDAVAKALRELGLGSAESVVS